MFILYMKEGVVVLRGWLKNILALVSYGFGQGGKYVVIQSD